mgnify:CR=1 FL=1
MFDGPFGSHLKSKDYGDAGVRVVRLRTGVVLSPDGGALAKMLPIFKAGAGGRLGSGRQVFSWIALEDVIGAIHFALRTPSFQGVANLTAPEPVTNAEFTRVLAKAMGRPALLPVPEFALRIGLGRSAERAVDSLRVVPARLVEAGFKHQHPNAPSVVGAALR